MHLRNGEPSESPIVRGPLDKPFCIGCRLCSVAGIKCVFGRFGVKSSDHMQLVSLRRHCEGRKHLAVCRKLGLEVRISEEKEMKLSLDRQVPDDSKFLWALTCVFSNSSFRDYERFLETEAMADLMVQRRQAASKPSVTTGSWAHTKMCKQVFASMAAVLDGADLELISNTVKSSFSVDDADQVRVMTLTCVAANPVVQFRTFPCSVVKDYGHSVDDCLNANWQSLRQSCFARHGPLDKDACVSDSSRVDEVVFKRLVSTIVAAATDGCEVEIQSIMKLQRTKIPSMRYFFRDRCHVSNCTHKAVMRFQQHQDVELLQLLVEGPQSFAKRVQYSRQFSTLWRQTQSGCVEDVFEVCAILSFCGSRYHSRTEPMITFLMKLSPCLQVLKLVSESHEPSSC